MKKTMNSIILPKKIFLFNYTVVSVFEVELDWKEDINI